MSSRKEKSLQTDDGGGQQKSRWRRGQEELPRGRGGKKKEGDEKKGSPRRERHRDPGASSGTQGNSATMRERARELKNAEGMPRLGLGTGRHQDFHQNFKFKTIELGFKVVRTTTATGICSL